MKRLQLIFAICFAGASTIMGQIENYSAKENGQKFDWLLYYLETEYVDSINSDSLTDLAIKRVVEELDPYSKYQTVAEVEAQRNADNGYSGKSVGFSFYMLRDTAVVTYVNYKGPAEKAGMKRGDQILKLGDKGLIGFDKLFLSDAINSETVEQLKLTILRNGNEQYVLDITKDRIPQQSVVAAYMMTPTTGYIKISRFNVNTMDEFSQSLNYLKSLGMQGLALDLRGNAGGVVEQALKLADIFLPPGKLVYTEEGFNREKKEFLTSNQGAWQTGKLVVIQDAATASASEIFLGAMQDWDRAVILGVSTYGKGLIQQSYKLGDGSHIRITVGKYGTPSGRYLQRYSSDNNDWMTPYRDLLKANSMTSKLNVTENLRGKSKTGRYIVTGPGGIVPDFYYVWQDPEDWQLYNRLNNAGYLYEYATDYVNTNRQVLWEEYNTVLGFHEDRIREAFMLKAFREFILAKDPKLILPRNFPENIIYQLKRWIISQLWHDNAYYEMKNLDDRTIFRAREILDGRVHDMLGISY